MPRKSTISKLPTRVREKLDALIRDGHLTIDELVAEVQAMGGEVKRTAVADYRQRMEVKLARMREAREVAGVWVAKFGEQPDSEMGSLLAQMLHTIAFQTLSQMGDGEAAAGPMDLMLLGKALKDLAGAEKTNQELRARIRAEFKAEIAERAKEAEKEIAKVGRKAGLTEEAAAEIRAKVLGIVS